MSTFKCINRYIEHIIFSKLWIQIRCDTVTTNHFFNVHIVAAVTTKKQRINRLVCLDYRQIHYCLMAQWGFKPWLQKQTDNEANCSGQCLFAFVHKQIICSKMTNIAILFNTLLIIFVSCYSHDIFVTSKNKMN